MKFACSSCGQRLEAESEMSGRQIDCPCCAATITIPSDSAAVLATPETRAPAIAPRPWSRRPAWALAVVLLVGLLGAGSWLLFKGKITAAKGGLPRPALLAFFKHADLAEVKVFPTEVNLKSKQDRQSVVVQAIYADGATRDVTSDASYSFANRALVKMSQNVLYPLTDGKTELQVKFEGRVLTVPVVVQEAKGNAPSASKWM